jgi:hypothetical protein
MENLIIGIFSTFCAILFGRIILYFITILVESIVNRYFKKPDYISIVSKILDDLQKNDQFISEVTNLMNSDNEIDQETSLSIVSLAIVQDLIQSEIDNSKIKLDKAEIESYLNSTFLRAWGKKL